MALVLAEVAIADATWDSQGWTRLHVVRCPRMGTVQCGMGRQRSTPAPKNVFSSGQAGSRLPQVLVCIPWIKKSK